MQEIWKDINIDGLKGKYQVSNLGNIKSLKRNISMKLIHDKDGYPTIFLWKYKRKVHIRVHRMVTQAFIPNPENLPQVNHKDGNKQNNCVKNLEWVTCSENVKHAYKTGLNKARQGNENHLSKKIIQYDINMRKIAEYEGIREAERRTGFDNGYISACCLGKYKKAYGYIWKYKEEQKCSSFFGGV